jgi:hypothetical protein
VEVVIFGDLGAVRVGLLVYGGLIVDLLDQIRFFGNLGKYLLIFRLMIELIISAVALGGLSI